MNVIMLRRGAKKRPIQQMVWLQSRDIQSADSKYNPAPPVHNVQHVLGDVELYPGEALHPGDVHGEDDEDLTILGCDWSGQCDTVL